MSASSAEEVITVLVADPDPEARRLVREALDTDEGTEVVGEAETNEETAELVLDVMPDVAAVAAGLLLADEGDLAVLMRDSAPATRVLVISNSSEQGYEAIRSGALSGCAARGGDPFEEAVKGVARGESMLTSAWATALQADIDSFDKGTGPDLSATEREVIDRLAAGETASDIAVDHDVTDRLVNLHAGYAVTKLQRALADRRGLAAYQ